MRTLSPGEISRYVALDQPLHCVGSFKWESFGITLFEAMRTDDPTALEGLPLIALSELLREAGVSLPLAAQMAQHWLKLRIEGALKFVVLSSQFKCDGLSMQK
jgi:hypothetical protein